MVLATAPSPAKAGAPWVAQRHTSAAMASSMPTWASSVTSAAATDSRGSYATARARLSFFRLGNDCYRSPEQEATQTRQDGSDFAREARHLCLAPVFPLVYNPPACGWHEPCKLGVPR